MDRADQERVQQFLDSWLGSGGNERANYQGFFLDLCRALNVEGLLRGGSFLNQGKVKQLQNTNE